MEGSSGVPREIAVPVSVFGHLRRELTEEVGALPTIHALHHAGYQAGIGAARSFTGRNGDLDSMGQKAFWAQMFRHFSQRGWGTLGQGPTHPGVGTLESSDWAEARPGEDDPDGSCCFSAGYISGMMTQLAGGPVAVLEVRCRTRGDDRCTFAFGSETAIHDLYGRLLDGVDLDAALAEL